MVPLIKSDIFVCETSSILSVVETNLKLWQKITNEIQNISREARTKLNILTFYGLCRLVNFSFNFTLKILSLRVYQTDWNIKMCINMICLRPSNVTYWLFGNNGIYHTIHLSRPSASSSLSIWLFGPVSQCLIVSLGLKPIFSTMSWTPSSAVMFLLLWSWHKSCSTSVTWSKETSQLCRLIIFANISQSLRFHVREH